MDFALLAGKFNVGDIVFAEQCGYMPWPGRLIAKKARSGMIQFVCTNERKEISYRKMWPYSHKQKKTFVTKAALEYEDFREAILMAERLMGCNDDDAVHYVWHVMHSGAVHKPKKPSTSSARPARTQRQIELAYVQRVRRESSSLRVETHFVGEINTLRRSLTIGPKNYEAAHAALQELLKMPVSQLLLLRNFEAVNSIRQLCRFAPTKEPQTANRDDARVVRSKANKLMTRFVSCFKLPYTKPDFWSEFIWLSECYMRYTVDFFPNWRSD